jgi:hypothetical protein
MMKRPLDSEQQMRDKVYALLGIAEDNDRLKIRINYSEDCNPADLYKDVSRALLTHGQLEVLTLRPRTNTPNNLPSWVCDWSSNLQLPFGSIKMTKPFSASGFSKYKISFQESGQAVVVVGLRVDEISQTGTPTTPDAIENGIYSPAALGFLWEIQNLCFDMPEADLARFLIGDLPPFREDAWNSNLLPSLRRATPEGALQGF